MNQKISAFQSGLAAWNGFRPLFKGKCLLALCGLGLLPLLAACSPEVEAPKPSPPETFWLSTWSTGPQLVEPHNMPPEPGLSNNTLRQVVRVSHGGESIRLKFSNEFSSEPVTLNAVQIAQDLGEGAVDTASSVSLSFGGEASYTMVAGGTALSDPIAFSLNPGSNVAITIYFGATSADLTGHPGSRTTSYLAEGNALSVADLGVAVRTDHWYVLTGIEVQASAPSAAVVVLGDSISDGRGSGTNKQNRWPDELARRLRENAGTEKVAVVNQGIGGNCVLRECLGPSALDRFERDVLKQSRVRWLIVFEGINDIGQVKGEDAAAQVVTDLISAYSSLIDQAHGAGIKVYGATLLPFGDSFYDGPERESARAQVNEWIRSSGRFDAVIDLEASLAQADAPTKMLAEADTGDHLHPNETGHRLLAEAVDLNLFK